jgi:hypothetical protein
MASGYSYQPQAPFIRTSMDSGLARQRRRFISIPSQVTVTWTLDQGQLALFEAFVHYDLIDGCAWFSARIMNGVGMRSVKARMIDGFKVDIIDKGWWKVSATLETMNMPVLNMADYITQLGLGEDVMAPASSDLHSLVHVDLPGALLW